MKVLLQLIGRVTYNTEIELTKAEYDAYEARLKRVSSFGEDAIATELADKFHIDLGEPTDWGELSVDTFDPITRSKSDRGAAK